jgi:competence ComEA-like helix-hairpin-helix protein
MLVSIIMSCYNSDVYLKEAIDSIYMQSYQNWEIIFWDNGSTDNSASIANSYDKRLRYFFVEKTTPLGKARNLALKEAQGMYVAFLDCDDVFLPDKIKIQLSAMKENNAVLSYGSWVKINAKGEELTTLKGIGKQKAKAIVEYRKEHCFKTKNDLANVKGIGLKTVEKNKEDIKVGSCSKK